MAVKVCVKYRQFISRVIIFSPHKWKSHFGVFRFLIKAQGEKNEKKELNFRTPSMCQAIF